MKYEQCKKVFLCCGQYIAPTKACSDKTIYCPKCGKKMVAPVKTPYITIVKQD